MGYQKFCYWVDKDRLEDFKKIRKLNNIKQKEEIQIPCRALKVSREISCLTPEVWNGVCERRTSWYWKSEKVGLTLIISNLPIEDFYLGDPIVIKETDFRPDYLPSFNEITALIESKTYQDKKPDKWGDFKPKEIEFYRRWFQRLQLNEGFDFERIFIYHSANHANFIDPKFFINKDGMKIPYSISDSLHVCSSCMEFFDIVGEKWAIKYVIPCMGAVLFAQLTMDRYFEVRKLWAVNSGGRVPAF